MRHTIKRGATEIATIRPTGNLHTQIMGEEVVSMEFSLPQMVEFLTNDTVQVYGNTYYLGNEPVVEKTSGREYRYSLQFVGVKYELSKVQYFYPNSQNILNISEFSAIADANTLIDLVVQNANRIQSGWTKGTVATTQAKQVDFNGDNCLSALAKIAEAFELEYWVDGNKSIHIEERKQISGYTFEYGKEKGLKNITRTPLDNSNIVTRLYATGGEKNIPANYRNYSKNLKMPVAYLEKNTAKYGVIEHTKNFSDIFPKRLGTVTAIDANNPLIFTDANIDFDLNETDANGTVILINNVSAKIKFNSGQLAGYTFEIAEHGYDTDSKKFTLLKNTDEKDIEVPSTLLCPAVGDEYVLFDVKMPQAYITAAETQLQAEAQKYLDENCEQRHQYAMVADPFYFKAQNVNIKIGNTIRFIDTAFSLDANLRVISVTKDLQNPYKVDFELSEKATISNIVRTYIESQKQATAITRKQKYNAEMARRSYNFAKEIQDNVFDGEGYFDAQKIKPLSIETKMLSVGSRLQQLNLKDVVLKVMNNNTAVTNTVGQLRHLTIADTPRTWQIPANAQTTIGPGFHYIYAKAQRVGTNASIFISSNQIAVEEDATYYHFEIGYLGSIENGFRRIKTTYGFTQVSPGEITTGRISSANGQQYIDLKQDGIDIVGNISIMSGSPAYSQIASVQDSKIAAAKQEAQNYTDNVEIGGRNYILDSKNKYLNLTNNIRDVISYNISNDFKKNARGKKITFSATTEAENLVVGAAHFGVDLQIVYEDDTYIWSNFTKDNIIENNVGEKRVTRTIQLADKEIKALNSKYIFIRGECSFSKFVIKNVKLEVGTKATDWSPAPEDVESEINNGDLYLRGTGLNRNANRMMKLNGATVYDYGGRGLRLDVINRVNLKILFSKTYDTYGSSERRSELAGKLNSLDDSVIVCLTSYDSAFQGINTDIKSAIERCGGNGDLYMKSRIPYAFVGIPGIGKSSGIEAYTSNSTTAPYAEIYTKIVNGTPIGINSNYSAINEEITNFQNEVNTTFKDNIISEAERISIEKYKNSLNVEYQNLTRRTQAIYYNEHLNSAQKAELNTKVGIFISSHSNLISKIENAIADNQTTTAEKQEVDNAFSAYKQVVGNLSDALEIAIKEIETQRVAIAKQETQSYIEKKASSFTVFAGEESFSGNWKERKNDAESQNGKIIRVWRGWSGYWSCGGQMKPLKIGAKYRIYMRAKCKGVIGSQGVKFGWRGGKSGEYDITDKITTTYTTINCGLFTADWSPSQNPSLWFLNTNSFSPNDGSNESGLYIDWVRFVEAEVEDFIENAKQEAMAQAAAAAVAAENARIEAVNAKQTAANLASKTDFLSETKINGNTVATGTLQVGNSQGANAGITGVGVGDSVRFYAGSDFANRNNAPTRITNNGNFYAKKGFIGGIKIKDNGLGAYSGSFLQGDSMWLDNSGLTFAKSYKKVRDAAGSTPTNPILEFSYCTKTTVINSDGVTTSESCGPWVSY